MRIGTDGNFLNFGYWDETTNGPLQAQLNLTRKLARFGSFLEAKSILDVGSGYCTPAISWLIEYPKINVTCVNISGTQLLNAKDSLSDDKLGQFTNFKVDATNELRDRLGLLESTSTYLPIRSKSMDRIVAFESAQHFKPLTDFISESNRVLKDSGVLVLALPVISRESNLNHFSELSNLGILRLTWASEHYSLKFVRNILESSGFSIQEVELIGSRVYIPLADYFIKNKERIGRLITQRYPKFLKLILYRSMLKMKLASENGFIDYALIKSAKARNVL